MSVVEKSIDSSNSNNNQNGTVDEIVGSLVQEIDNELIHTMEESMEGDEEEDITNGYQLPLQEIGEETMEMIVDYNTRVNSDTNMIQNMMNQEESGIDDSMIINKVPYLGERSMEDVYSPVLTDSDMDVSGIAFSPLKRDAPIGIDMRKSSVQIEQRVDDIAQNIKQIQSHVEVNGIEEFSDVTKDSSLRETVNLPPLPKENPMFRNSSLARILDDSLDSSTENDTTEISQVQEPKDFLSVWHLQQEESSSPAFSNNSQFTGYTQSTTASSSEMKINTMSPRNSLVFKFKPRMVSESKIYQPRNVSNSRVTSKVYSLTDSQYEEMSIMNGMDSTILPYHEIANKVNLQIEKNKMETKPRLISLSNDSILMNTSEQFDDFEEEIGFSFDDILNKLDHLGDDTVSESDVSPNSMLNIGDNSINTPEEIITEDEDEEEEIILPRRHISSPFKIRKPLVEEDPSIMSIHEETVELSKSDSDETNIEAMKPEQKEEEEEEEEEEESRPLKDDGILFLNILGLENFKIDGYKYRNAKFCLEFRLNGKQIGIISWKQINSDKYIPISQEFGVAIDDDFKSHGKKQFEVVIKIQYDKITKQTVEVTRKVARGKKFPFGKTKYIYEKTFIDKPVEMDSWQTIIDSNGKYAAGQLNIDETFLNRTKFQSTKQTLPILNKFTQGKTQSPYSVGNLVLESLYVARSSNDEVIPLQLSKLEKVVSKHLRQGDIQMSGILLQEGGDITQGSIQRRFFDLKGTTLIGSHEMTNNPMISINLLNVEHITSSCNEQQVSGERKFTNLTDLVLFGDHIKLHFFNQETITLTSENGHDQDTMTQWHESLQEVISLNVSHQPWVKHICQDLH